MPYDERDDETQQFTHTYEDDEFVAAVRELEIAGTNAVADRVGCTTENARLRLDNLVDSGELRKRSIGHRNIYVFDDLDDDPADDSN